MNSNSPKYDLRVNAPYQIDWGNAAAGKKVAATKRRIQFKFGFSNREALERGLTGIDARGEEHEVTLIWSLTSGKRVVVADGKEVHFSNGRRADAKFETSWTMAGQHTLKIIAHAAPPIRDLPGFRQYDLLLDGMSFFDMPRIYELGLNKGVSRNRNVAVAPQEHGYAYKNYHMEEQRRYASAPSVGSEPGRFSASSVRRSTMEASTPERARPTPPQIAAPQDVLSEVPQQPIISDFLEAPATAPTNVVDEFTPVEARPEPLSFQAVSNQIMSAYPPAPAAPAPLALANEPHTYYQPAPPPPPQQQQQQYYGNHYAPQPNTTTYGAPTQVVSPDGSNAATTGRFFYNQLQPLVVDPNTPRPEQAPLVTPTMMQPLEVDELRDSPPPKDAMEKAVQNLVNLDDLNEAVVTPEQIKARKQKEATKKQNKSRPAPPASTDWHVGQNASLADIQQHKKPSTPPTKEVMRVHAFDPRAAQAGMMVVYGQQAPSQPQHQQQGGYMIGGIPPSTGFGTAMQSGYGYQQQPLRAIY